MTFREEFQLECGPVAVFEMPDMYRLMAGGYSLPNTALADVLALNNGRLNRATANEADEIALNRRIIVGGYEIAALCVVTPRIVLPRDEQGADGLPRPLLEGEISYRDLTQGEVTMICNKFRYGISIDLPPTKNNGSGVGTGSPSPGDTVPDAA